MMTKNLNSLLAILSILTMAFVSCKKEEDPTTAKTMVYASNNSNGDITVYDVSMPDSVKSTSYKTNSTAADGIYFDTKTNLAVQASRSSFSLEGYNMASVSGVLGTLLNLSLSSSDKMDNPRELAVNGDFYVVADSKDVDGDAATLDGRLFVFQKSGNSFALRNTITTDFKVWGIVFIGNDLYAVVDADNELAVFSDFLSNNTSKSLSATKRVEIEGIVRTHGICYDAQTNTLVMTDIGSAANTADDGGFHIINQFSSKWGSTANNGKIALSEQVRVAGSATKMGNPVDVAYDGATKTVFIAEAGNGKFLAYQNVSANGNTAPSMEFNLTAASAVYLVKQ